MLIAIMFLGFMVLVTWLAILTKMVLDLKAQTANPETVQAILTKLANQKARLYEATSPASTQSGDSSRR